MNRKTAALKFFIIFILIAVVAAASGCSRKNGEKNDRADNTPGTTAEDNVEDMYIRIYGKDAVVSKKDLVIYVPSLKYPRASSLEKADLEKHYQKVYSQGKKLLKENRQKKAVEKFLKCRYIEESRFKQPGLGKVELEKIKEESLKKAKEFYEKGEYKRAIEPVETAVKCDSSNPHILKLAGLIYSHTGDEGLAIPFLRAALAHTPKDTKLKFKLKNLYILEGKPGKAIPLITEDISKHTRHGTHWADLADAYLVAYMLKPKNEDLKNDVESALKKALSHRKLSSRSRIELQINRALLNNDYKSALQQLDALEQINTDPTINTRIKYNKALLNYALKDKKAGRHYLQETVKRAFDHLNISQGENYMALMSAWALDVTGSQKLTPKKAKMIYSRLTNPDHSYRQEFGYIHEFLQAREKRNYKKATAALEKLTKKRHLEPIGDFIEDLVQVPAEKALVYISMGKMYDRIGKRKKARACFNRVINNSFFGYRARKLLSLISVKGKF